MTPVREVKQEKSLDYHDLAELEKNVATRVKVDLVWDKVNELAKKLTDHMEKEDTERAKLDKKLLYLFLLASGNLVFTGGGDVAAFLMQLFM